MTILRGIVQFHPHSHMRQRLRNFADNLARARLSAHDASGRPLIALVISPEDRDMLVEAIRRMAEITVDDYQ